MLKQIKNYLRKFKFFNGIENKVLSKKLRNEIQYIKEENSQKVFELYYMPKAVAAVLHEQNYLALDDYVVDRARAMLLYDKAQGVLDEFYRFREVRN